MLSVAPLIGEAISRIHGGESVGALFSSEIQLVQEMLLWGDASDDEEPPFPGAAEAGEVIPAASNA